MFKKLAPLLLLALVCSCGTNPSKNVESEKENSVSPKEKIDDKLGRVDEKGCVVEREGLTTDDIRKDEETGKHYTPDGEEVTLLEILALIPGVSVCKLN